MPKIFFLLALGLTAGCNQQNAGSGSEGDKLMQLSRDWSAVAATGNLDTTLSFWADDAIIMAPGEPPLKGKTAIRGMLEGTSKISGFRISWEPKEVHVSSNGDMAYMIEETKITMQDSLGKPFTQNNKALTVWRKEPNGEWKNVVDMWNANPAPK